MQTINWVAQFVDGSSIVFAGVDCDTAAAEYAGYRAMLRGGKVARVKRAEFAKKR